MSDGRGNYTRCSTKGCKKKAVTGHPYRHCKPHALVKAFEVLKVTPAMLWAVCQIVEFEVERKVRELDAVGEHQAGNQR